MFHMRTLAASLSTGFAVALMTAGSAGAYPTGEVSGAATDPGWHAGRVENMSVTYDSCYQDGSSTCEWTALAGTMPAANGSCPHDWYKDGPQVQLWMFWGSAKQTANAPVSSGPQDFQLNGAYGQRVCLYVERVFSGGNVAGRVSSVVASSALAERPPTAPPAPPPPAAPAPVPPPSPVNPVPSPQMTQAESVSFLRDLLRQRYTTFRRGHGYRRSCKRLTAVRFSCRVRWAYRTHVYRGTADLRLATNDDVKYQLRVKRS